MMEDLPVGKTKNGATDSAEPAITGDVASGAWEVGCPIGFNHESCLAAEEVEDERPKRMLSSELGADERSVA
jgi:invasion protein IalB